MFRSAFLALTILVGEANAQWQLIAPIDQLPSFASDAVVQPDAHVRMNMNVLDVASRTDRVQIMELTPTGIVTDTVEILVPSATVLATHLYWSIEPPLLLATGLVVDTSQQFGFAQQGFVAEVSSGAVDLTRYGAVAPAVLDGLGFIDADGSFVFGHYDFTDINIADFKYRASRYCLGQGICDSSLLWDQEVVDRMHAMGRVSNGEIISIMPMTEQGCSYRSAAIIHLTDELENVGCSPILPLDTGYFGLLSSFDDNISLLTLSSGNILLCGVYWHDLPSSVQRPVAIQRARPEGGALGRRMFANPTNNSAYMRPAIFRGMSAFSESEFAFAYSDLAFNGGPWPFATETSNIHVLRMDTALNILGEYVFNGDTLDRYHFVSSVVAAPDGAVYVVGSVYDHQDAVPHPKSWIARVGPEQFVGVPELQQVDVSLFPNPGADGFTLSTPWLKPGAQVQLFDQLGALVATERIVSENQWLSTAPLASGLYLVRLTANDGSTWTGRWVKE